MSKNANASHPFHAISSLEEGDDTHPLLDLGDRNAAPLLLPGAEIGDYTVERSLLRGGMGALFLVSHVVTGQPFALKAIPKQTSSSTAPERFRQEIEILKSLNHPHIVRLYEHGESDSLVYYVMDYLSGGSLFDRLSTEGPLPPIEALTVVMDVSRAIHYAHQQQLLHRDLKPENILFAADKRPVLIDFGVAFVRSQESARITQKGHIVGTPFYMPPERFLEGESLTAQSDVYGLGIVLYETLVGYNPFCREKPTEAIMKIAEGRLPPLRSLNPDLSVELEELCRLATTRRLDQRFATARAFTNACSALLRSMLLSA